LYSQAAQLFHEKFNTPIYKIWVETTNERRARMTQYTDALDEYTLRRVFPFPEMLPLAPSDMP
jgi:hypothetical protein